MENLKLSQIPGIVILALLLTAVGLIMVILPGPGSRFGWWGFRTGITILKWGGYISVAAVVISLASAFITRSHGFKIDFILSIVSIIISLSLTFILLQWQMRVKNVPMIHDITTDTKNPPLFSKALIALRKDATNQFEYGGPEIANQQLAAYPDIGPLFLKIGTEQAFAKALKVARDDLCWNIVYENQQEGRIEATDTTFWFGFKDDIVIRIIPEGKSSRVDIRSVSRVGKSDVGTNAKRIRSFIKKLGKSNQQANNGVVLFSKLSSLFGIPFGFIAVTTFNFFQTGTWILYNPLQSIRW